MSFKTNLSKTIRYFKKNGLTNTCYALVERVFFPYYKDYRYISPKREELEKQRSSQAIEDVLFSIVVPTFETNKVHLGEMIQSVLNQSYEKFELILVDASQSSVVIDHVSEYDDARIIYHKLSKNAGISENTNAGIHMARGNYIALLDHDDMLTPDALYQMASKITEEKNKGKIAKIIFSDEDKCNGEGTVFFEPYYKTEYNKALLYTNNYICHFLVSEADMMKELLLRKEYDGAQDFDYVLRATNYVNNMREGGMPFSIAHVNKILYHWRCHEQSTASNPESKMYAYDAGKRAVNAALEAKRIGLKARHGRYLGFYELDVDNKSELLNEDCKIGCVGGAVYKKNKIVGGALDEQGRPIYKGLHKKYDGYMKRAHLMQNVSYVDIRNIIVKKELRGIFEEVTKLPYITKSEMDETFHYKQAVKTLETKPDYKELSIEFCKRVGKDGYEIIYWEP